MVTLTGQNFDGVPALPTVMILFRTKQEMFRGSMSLHLVARTVLTRFCYGHAIRWDSVAQLLASMLCIEVVN